MKARLTKAGTNFRERVVPGEIVNATLDLIVCHEVTTPPAVAMLRARGIHKVFDPSRILVTPDHFVPNKDILSAELAKSLRAWREEQDGESDGAAQAHGRSPGLALHWRLPGRDGQAPPCRRVPGAR